jgi:hypothetical protein
MEWFQVPIGNPVMTGHPVIKTGTLLRIEGQFFERLLPWWEAAINEMNAELDRMERKLRDRNPADRGKELFDAIRKLLMVFGNVLLGVAVDPQELRFFKSLLQEHERLLIFRGIYLLEQNGPVHSSKDGFSPTFQWRLTELLDADVQLFISRFQVKTLKLADFYIDDQLASAATFPSDTERIHLSQDPVQPRKGTRNSCR